MKNKRPNSELFWHDAVFKIEAKECLHTKCTECKGTGVKNNKQPCVHYISCNCKRCNPATLSSGDIELLK